MGQQHHDGLQISPLLLGLLGVMAGALAVATLHCVVVCWCNDAQRTRSTRTISTPTNQQRQNVDEADYRQQQASSSNGGSFSSMQVIITSNYTKESKEDLCAVCLSEINEGDEVRILPECTHIFHVACIDKWLDSHHNCPLCRAETLSSPRDIVRSLSSSDRLYRIPDYS